MLLSAILSAGLSIYAWQHRNVPGARSFSVQSLSIAIWALFTAIEIASTTLSTKIFCHKIEIIAAAASLSALAYFAIELAGPVKWANRRTARLLFMVVLISITIMATNDYHHLFWIRLWFDQFIRIERGPLNIVIVLYCIFLPFFAAYLFLKLFLRSTGIYRQQAFILMIGALLPVLTYFLEFFDMNPLAPLDPVILACSTCNLMYAFAIFRFRMLDVVPIGRDMAIERMTNGVIIFDVNNQIVDFNPAAGEILGIQTGKTLSHPAEDVLSAYPELAKILETRATGSAELVIPRENQPRYFQAQVSLLTHTNGYHLGQLALIQDVTDQRQAQAQRLEQLWAQASLQEREHLADELHDGLSQNLAFLNMQAQAAQVYLMTGQAEATQTSLERLVEASRQIQEETRLLIDNLLAVSMPAEKFCVTLRKFLTGFENQTGLPVRLELINDPEQEGVDLCDPSQMPPRVSVELIRIVQEALANVRKHAINVHQVEVVVREHNRLITLIIQDDGAGFDLAGLQLNEKHFGLRVMRQRTERIGGQFSIDSAPGKGTRIEVRVPVSRLDQVAEYENFTG